MKKISVIVPVYNVEDYLEKCLDSLVNQTLKDIEIIIVNDGSPDNSQKIIDKYQKKYSQIKSYQKVNGGLSDARNFGIEKATGEYIALIDSDDYISIDMCEKMYQTAKEEDLDIVVCDCYKVYPNSQKKILLKSNLHFADNSVSNYLLSFPMACTRIYKRNLFNKIKFTKNIFYEDLELTPKLVNYTKKIGFVEEGLYYYLQRDGSIMKQQKFNSKLLDIFTVLKTNYEKLYNNYPEEIEYMYISHLLRTATLRFLNYQESSKYLEEIYQIMKTLFPNWNKNIYYKKSSKKLKLICFLSYHKQYQLLKLLNKFNS